MNHPFDRPVFIVAAPRSCSTLLFQTLSASATLWTLGDESHAIFEGHRKLAPLLGAVDSNRFTAALLDPALARSIPAQFARGVHDSRGRRLVELPGERVRLLEKTPKNSLRIPFIDALFPDARFIFLVRDARANIASIIEAWRSGGFTTYPRFRTAHGPWSLLLPPGWKEVLGKPLEEIAAFQWCSANQHIVGDLAQLPRERWTALNADELLQDPLGTVSRLCSFMEIELDAALRASLADPLPLSRYTLSKPAQDKWQAHAGALARVWPQVTPVIEELNRFVAGTAVPLPTEAPVAGNAGHAMPETQSPTVVARNQPCPCGSGRRYKACHGSLSIAGATRGEQ